MGLSWQQGPLGRDPNGRFLVPGKPERVLYAEPLRRRLRAELHLLDSGHFATATHSGEIAELIAAFLDRHVGLRTADSIAVSRSR